MIRSSIAVTLALALVLPPSVASAQTVVASTPVPSFNESSGCDDLQGLRGPYVSKSGTLSNAEVVRGPWGDFYGRTIGDIRSRLVRVTLPNMDRDKPILVHERVLPAYEQVIANLEAEAAKGNIYPIRADHTFSYNPATIPPHSYLSFHAVGASIDINSTTNPYSRENELITDMPDWFVKAWTDAGWCWGGDWQSIKDPMHFSWKGPLHTPNFETPPPYPAETASATYDQAFSVPTALTDGPGPGSTTALGDVDRDGAVDLIRVRGWVASDRLAMEVARSKRSYESCLRSPSTVPTDLARRWALVADFNRDHRVEVGLADVTGALVVLDAFDWRSWMTAVPTRVSTGIPTDELRQLTTVDLDRDGWTDLAAVKNDGTVTVYAGPEFTGVVATLRFAPREGNQQVFFGDHDLDGFPDAYRLDDTGKLEILMAGDLFATGGAWQTPVALVPGATAGTSDWDGDGRPDVFVVDPDGTLRVVLASPDGSQADGYWFVDPKPDWELGEGCSTDAAFESRPEAVGAVAAAQSADGALVVMSPTARGTALFRVGESKKGYRSLRRLLGDPEAVFAVGDVLAAVTSRSNRWRVTELDPVTGDRLSTTVVKGGVAAAGTGEAVLVLGNGPAGSKVSVIASGALTDVVEFAGIDGVAVAGTDGLVVVVGWDDAGSAVMHARSVDGALVAARALDVDPASAVLSAGPDGLVLVGETPGGHWVATALVPGTLEDLGRYSVGQKDVIGAALVGAGPTVTLVRRVKSEVFKVETLDLSSGIREWRRRLLTDLTPFVVLDAGHTTVVVSQRFADGAVGVKSFVADTGRRACVVDGVARCVRIRPYR